MRQQDAHVLGCGDQVILNLLSPQPPPASSLEVVIVGGISKTRFHQVLAPFAITTRGDAVSLSARYI